jgi:hypothetical protein
MGDETHFDLQGYWTACAESVENYASGTNFEYLHIRKRRVSRP